MSIAQYINGNLSTGATHSTGTAAPTGTNWSELQGTNGTLGSGANITAGYSLADNFTVPAGPSWILSKFTFYAYSTGFTGTTSPFVDVRLQIFNTDPTVGNPTPIYGDLTTNRFYASSFANLYRTGRTAADQTRKVWQVEANVNVTLPPGNYWVEWALGNGGISNFTPLNTVVGNANPGGNAQQRNFSAGLPGTWAAVVDGSSTFAQDVPFKIDYATGPCSGTPAPGNTISTLATVCSGVSFTLTLQNATPGTGVTYQWQSSPDGTTWTNISGATNTSYSGTQNASTYYRCQVTCSGNNGYSTGLLVAMSPSSSCYCAAGATSTSFEKISNVKFGTINNTSTSTAGYENFTSISATVIKGEVVPATVTISGGYSTDQVFIWIDFNQNGSFTDPGELVYTSAQGVGPHTGNATISATALTGNTRMRVRMHDASFGANSTPCGNSSYGQVEDYTLNIQPCVEGNYTSHPSNASITCGGNATFTAAASGSAIAYTWQYRTSATGIWQELPNGGVVTGATTATLTLTNLPVTYNGYQFRSIIRGACTGANPSNPATLSVAPIQTTVNPSSATICSGGSQMLAITNIASTSAPTTRTFTSTDVPKPIPDNSAAGVLSNIVVSGLPTGATITGIAVKLTIPDHTWIGDVVAALKTPNGKVINLDYYISGTGYGPGSGMVNCVISSAGTTWLANSTSPTFTGTFRADLASSGGSPTSMPLTTNQWSAIYGGPAAGTYTLGLFDGGGGDVGTLTAWSIDVTYVQPAYGQGIWTASPATPNTMFTDAACLVPYVTGATDDTIYVKPTVNTNYTVYFNSSLSPCTSATATVPVNVGIPVTGVTAPATVATCTGSGFSITATHTAVPSTNVAATYQWQVSSDGGVNWTNISGATSTTLTVPNSASSMNGYRYRIAVTSSACAASYSTPTVLTVYALPTVTLSAPATTLTPGKTITIIGSSTPAAATWAWSLNGATLAGATNSQVATVDGLGSYQATVRDVNGCVNSSNKLTITAEASDKLWIYPNPTSGAFQIRYYHAGDANEKRVISVYNAAGQLVATKSFDLTYTSAPYLRMDVDLSGAARGTYVVKVAHAYSGKIVSGLVLVQ